MTRYLSIREAHVPGNELASLLKLKITFNNKSNFDPLSVPLSSIVPTALPYGWQIGSRISRWFSSSSPLGHSMVRLNTWMNLRVHGETRILISIDTRPSTHILIMQVTDTNACLGAPRLCLESSWILQLTIAFPAKSPGSSLQITPRKTQ